MTTIRIQRTHSLDTRVLRQRLEPLAQTLEERYQLDCRWEGDAILRFQRTGATGEVRLEERVIVLELTLGWLLRPLRGQIEAGIEAALDEALRDA